MGIPVEHSLFLERSALPHKSPLKLVYAHRDRTGSHLAYHNKPRSKHVGKSTLGDLPDARNLKPQNPTAVISGAKRPSPPKKARVRSTMFASYAAMPETACGCANLGRIPVHCGEMLSPSEGATEVAEGSCCFMDLPTGLGSPPWNKALAFITGPTGSTVAAAKVSSLFQVVQSSTVSDPSSPTLDSQKNVVLAAWFVSLQAAC